MKKANFKFLLHLTLAVILTLGLSISLQSLLAAWTAPTADPPGSNVPPPINEGSGSQVKSGGLGIGSNFLVGTDVFYVDEANGNVGIGTTNPNQLLHLVKAGDTAIHFEPISSLSSGPNNGGIFADDTSVGTVTWSSFSQDPANAQASDDVWAVAAYAFGDFITYYLKATDFGFSIPAGATISGIVVEVEQHMEGTIIQDNIVRIVKNGVISGDDKADTVTNWFLLTDEYKSYGGSGDLWGLTWTPADINANDFGVAISAAGNASFAFIDHIRITVYYAGGLAVWTVGGDYSDSNNFKISGSTDLGTDDYFTIEEGGNVGIGTTDPNAKFEVDMKALTTTEGFKISRDAAASHYAYLNIEDESSNPIFKVHENGNVGIGTTEPEQDLHIADGGEILLESNSSTGIRFKTIDSGNDYDFGMKSSSGAFWFFSQDRLGNPWNRIVTIKPDGSVGIGTVDPSHILTVSGVNRDIAHYSYDDCDLCGADYEFYRARGTEAVPESAQEGDKIGSIRFRVHDGTGFYTGAQIRATAEGSFGTDSAPGDVPSKLEFLTTPNVSVPPAGTPTVRMVIDKNGNLGIGTTSPGSYRLYVSGADAYCDQTTCWNDASDIALKKNITDLEYGIDEVMKIKPRRYTSKITNETSIGMIAQEIETVVPEVVSGEEGSKGISYGSLTPVLINAIKQLKLENEEKQEQISALKQLVCIDHPEAEICQ